MIQVIDKKGLYSISEISDTVHIIAAKKFIGADYAGEVGLMEKLKQFTI